MTNDERIAALKDRHANLDAALQEEANRPRPDTSTVAELKKEKLRIKDEIAALKRTD